MEILICIDDTDNLDSMGTGEILENMIDSLQNQGLAECSFVTRHQLYIHPEIAYTSHNSSMCTEGKTEQLEAVIDFCREYLAANSAEGSDPGLCIVLPEKLANKQELLEFSFKSKETVRHKAEAFALAEKYPEAVFLSEHGGTGDGVIGALAGCGLRISGNDGRIKGKFKPRTPNEIHSVAEFCRIYGVDRVLTLDKELLAAEEQLVFKSESKALFLDFQKTVYVAKDPEDGGLWHPLSKKELPDNA
ncbi:MAG: hypothetical protein IJP33_03325 [Firmicutes bacterium]|nr:hypothetical protein [Bacillota bacterium]